MGEVANFEMGSAGHFRLGIVL